MKETTFQNYVRALGIIRNLFGEIQLKDLNDIVVQKKIDEYSKTRSRKTTHEVLLKIKTSLRDAYARNYIANDFALLVKTRGVNPPKQNKALSITDFKKLRNHVLQHPEDEFNLLVLLALEVRHSISPTSDDTLLKTQNAKRDVSINKEMYEFICQIPVRENGYIFNFDGFKQSELLGELLNGIRY